MRGALLVSMLALTVSLTGTAQAAHLTDSTALAVDLGEERLLDDRPLYDLLALPSEVRDQARSHAEAHLPGPNDPLHPDMALLDAPAGTFALTDDLVHPIDPLSSGSTAEQDATQHADVYEATEASAPSQHPIWSDMQDDGTDQASAQHETTPAEDDTTLATQSNAAGQPSMADRAREAWNDLSPAEKTAVGAGIASLLLLGPLTMYSRIKRDDALENDTRRGIYEIVEANPGICIKDVAEEADVSYSTASYHLDRLVKMDYLARREEGNKVLYYKNGGTFNNEERELVPILKNQEAMRVFQHILENPWCYRAEVAEALGVSHTTVNWHLKRLSKADLVEEHREGRSCHLHIPEPALDRVVSVVDKLEELGVEEEYAQVAGPVPA